MASRCRIHNLLGARTLGFREMLGSGSGVCLLVVTQFGGLSFVTSSLTEVTVTSFPERQGQIGLLDGRNLSRVKRVDPKGVVDFI